MTYYTKPQLLKRLNQHYKTVVEILETDNKLTVQADKFKIEIKKEMVANFDRTMVLRYGY